jgi:hypothetical protein
MEEFNERIDELVVAKNFKQLTNEEKALVLNYITAEEYKLRREVVMQATETLEQEAHFLSPDPQIKASLMDALNARKTSWTLDDIFDKIFGTKIPAYQAAFGVAVLVVAFTWHNASTAPQIITEERIVYQPTIDTVYLTEEIPVETIRIVERIVKVYPKEEKKIENNFVVDSNVDFPEEVQATDNMYAFTDSEIEEQQQKSMGNTALLKDDLAQFLVVIN